MKQRLILCLCLLLLMIFIPFLSMGAYQKDSSSSDSRLPAKETSVTEEASSSEIPESPVSSSLAPSAFYSEFKILDQKTEEILVVPDREFLYGAVATEMLPSFQKEALKAQAVACYTHFCRLRAAERENPSSELMSADFSANPSGWKYYVTKGQMQSRWGEQFEESYQAIKEAVDAVYGEVLEYDGELITAAYHAISGGNTESSEDVFGGKVDYLISVPSPGDLLAPDYQTTAEFTAEEFENIAKEVWPDLSLEGEPNLWVGDAQKTDSGTVRSIQIGSKELSGQEVRTAFSLRSADFDLLYTQNRFLFTVRGYGHGVGMSQYGAQYMAQQGADYRQILNWYYPGTVLTVSK